MKNHPFLILAILTCIAALATLPPLRDAADPAIRPAPKIPSHFLLGVISDPGDRWLADTRTQGDHFDVRYRYLAGGVNTKGNWRTWNSPPGQYALSYMQDSDRQGLMPCLTYYQMYQSLPCGGKGDEAKGNKTNMDTPDTMKAYFEDFKVLMQKAGEFGKPVIIHHDPDLWGYMSQNQAFASGGSNDADKVKVSVKSSGFPEAATFEDTAAGFGKCLVSLRDKYAPKALLAWHASKWGGPDPRAQAAFCLKSGRWDFIFTDPSDRDVGWKNAHGQNAALWTEKDFNSFRDWSGQLHQLTGLPLMAWQIPMGNTVMATCDNTDGHYMDNRVEYFLENYPANTHMAEWAARGYVGLLWGGGAGGCTDCRDGKKDGVTNPTPIKGNKGEKATFPDDDGGYLRTRAAAYYKKPLVFKNGTLPSPESATTQPTQ